MTNVTLDKPRNRGRRRARDKRAEAREAKKPKPVPAITSCAYAAGCHRPAVPGRHTCSRHAARLDELSSELKREAAKSEGG